MRGRLKAKKKQIEQSAPDWDGGGLKKVRLVNPPEQDSKVEFLGTGDEAVQKILEILKELGMV